MAEVYYYLPAAVAARAVECGLKLSEWYDKEVMIEGQMKKCLSALLNPKDDLKKYQSGDLVCVKIDMPSKYCFVADKLLYLIGQNSKEGMDMYLRSIIPIEDYIFGSYRLPECLVTSTPIAGQISVLDKRMDSPILFNSSEELYINNTIEVLREEHDDINDALLYSFFSELVKRGRLEKIENGEEGLALFLDRGKNKYFIVNVPDMGRY